MRPKYVLLLFAVCVFIFACFGESYKEGTVVRVDYRNAEMKDGDWIMIDSFKLEHIGKRMEANNVKYPLPSNKVEVDTMFKKNRKRDYNPKTFATFAGKHLSEINNSLPKMDHYLVTNRFLMSYRGVLEIVKRDSSDIRVKTSANYDANVEVIKK